MGIPTIQEVEAFVIKVHLTNLEREEPFFCPHGVKGFQLLIIFIKVFKKDLFGHYLGNQIYNSFQQKNEYLIMMVYYSIYNHKVFFGKGWSLVQGHEQSYLFTSLFYSSFG